MQKYQHRFCNTGFGSLTFTPLETAILCELLLRGAQTPGELKTRTPRMAEVHDIADIESALLNLATREDGPFVVQLPREHGRRDSRYAHLLSGDVEVPESSAASDPVPRAQPQSERIEKLEGLVAELRRELDELKAKLE